MLEYSKRHSVVVAANITMGLTGTGWDQNRFLPVRFKSMASPKAACANCMVLMTKAKDRQAAVDGNAR